MPVEVFLSQDVTAAVVEAIMALATTIISVSFVAIAMRVKVRKLAKTGYVYLSPNDFTSGVGALKVILLDRYVSFRGIFALLITIALLTLSATALLGTVAARCHTSGKNYSGLTNPANTTCYSSVKRPVATSGRAHWRVLGRLRELLTIETDVNVRVHPTDFDLARDAVTDFSGIISNPWGTVLSVASCNHSITWTPESNTVDTASAELNELIGTGGQQPGPSVQRRVGRFGFENDVLEELTGLLFAKEINNDGTAVIYLLQAYAQHDKAVTISDTKCAKLEFAGSGLRVIPFSNTAAAITSRNVSILRLAEVAWLGATLSEQVPRQEQCVRQNYMINECTAIGLNTLITVVGTAVASLVIGVLALIMFLYTRKDRVSKLCDRYQLCVSAARDKEGGQLNAEKNPNRIRVSLTGPAELGHISWEEHDAEHRPENEFSILE